MAGLRRRFRCDKPDNRYNRHVVALRHSSHGCPNRYGNPDRQILIGESRTGLRNDQVIAENRGRRSCPWARIFHGPIFQYACRTGPT